MNNLLTIATIALSLALTACVSTGTDDAGNRQITAATDEWGADVLLSPDNQFDSVVLAGPEGAFDSFPLRFVAETDVDAPTNRPTLTIRVLREGDTVTPGQVPFQVHPVDHRAWTRPETNYNITTEPGRARFLNGD